MSIPEMAKGSTNITLSPWRWSLTVEVSFVLWQTSSHFYQTPLQNAAMVLTVGFSQCSMAVMIIVIPSDSRYQRNQFTQKMPSLESDLTHLRHVAHCVARITIPHAVCIPGFITLTRTFALINVICSLPTDLRPKRWRAYSAWHVWELCHASCC